MLVHVIQSKFNPWKCENDCLVNTYLAGVTSCSSLMFCYSSHNWLGVETLNDFIC